MSRYYEFEGKNIDDAVRNACDTLKIEKDNLKYEVIQSGSGGFLGLVGKKLAKIRVMRVQEQEKSVSDQDKEIEVKVALNENKTESNQTENKSVITESTESRLTSEEKGEDELPIDMARNALERILDSITIDSTITVIRRDPIEFMVNGPYAGVIIGKHGQTLDAIQYLVEKIVSRKFKKHIRLEIDVEGYLKKRRENLIKLAQRLSEKAKISRRPITIGVLNAQERRIVHIALKEKPGVRTQSVGSGVMRKIIVYPQKNNQPKK